MSEIFPIQTHDLNWDCFRLYPEVTREIGNRLSWRFSQRFPRVRVIWCDWLCQCAERNRAFWVIAKANELLPSCQQWDAALTEIQTGLRDEIGNRNYSIEKETIEPTAEVIASWAERILKIEGRLPSPLVREINGVEIRRQVKLWSETIQLRGKMRGAIALTVETEFLYGKDLATFFASHPQKQEPEKLLIGLQVSTIEHKSKAEIVALNGTIAQQRERLILKASSAFSQR